jgi:hypothetical protein
MNDKFFGDCRITIAKAIAKSLLRFRVVAAIGYSAMKKGADREAVVRRQW